MNDRSHRPRRSRWTTSPIDRPDDEQTEAASRRTRPAAALRTTTDPLLQELVAYLRENRTELREEWARRISEAELLGVMSDEEIFSEATEVYDNYVDALETGSIETLQTYARELSERIIPRGVETHEVLGIVLLLRDVLARSLFAKYQEDLRAPEPHPRRLRAGREPDRGDRRGELRRGARAGHQRAAGGHAGAVDAGPAAARAPAHPADHRRARLGARAPAHRAAPGGDPGQPRHGRGHRHHRRRHDRPHRGQPPRPDRRGLAAHGRAARSSPACRRRSPRRSSTSASISA